MPIGPNTPYSNLSQEQILQRSFEETEDRLRVDANVTAVLGTVECIIDAASGDNIAIHDAGGDELQINPDGSINVSVITGVVQELKIEYNEILALASGITTNIVNFTPGVDIKIIGISVSGTNIATYEILKNAAVIDKKYTYFGGGLSEEFKLEGLFILSGQNIKVAVVHFRPTTGDFNASVKYIEV